MIETLKCIEVEISKKQRLLDRNKNLLTLK